MAPGIISEVKTRRNVAETTENVSALTRLFAATLGSPVLKVAAFSYGVRKAAAKRRHDEQEREVRDTLKAQRRAARRGRTGGVA